MHTFFPKFRAFGRVDLGGIETEDFADDALVLEMSRRKPFSISAEHINDVALLGFANTFAHSA